MSTVSLLLVAAALLLSIVWVVNAPAAGAASGVILVEPVALSVSEPDGQDVFTITLVIVPTDTVTIALSTSDTTECVVEPPSLEFTPENYEAVITVAAQNDDIDDGDQLCTVETVSAVSNDPTYSGEDADDVIVTVADDDVAGFALEPTTPLSVAEPDGQATFTLYLTSQPTDTVTIALSTTDSTECIVNSPSLVLTPDTWQTGATATVAAQDDDIADGDQPCTIVTGPAVSDDPLYGGGDPDDVAVTVTDDDFAGFALEPTTPLTVSEPNGQAIFTMSLTSEPTATVSMGLTVESTQCGVEPAKFDFTLENWQTGITATVTAQDDEIADGPRSCQVTIGRTQSDDPLYDHLIPPPVEVTVTDDDIAGFDLSTSTLEVSEPDGQATFTLYLTSQPTDTVTIALSTTDTTECIVDPSSLVLTPDTWQTGATATVTAQDDDIADGDQPCTIVTGPAVSTNPAYNDQDPDDVAVTVTDDDVAGFVIEPTTLLTVAEPDGQATFTLYLTFAPTDTVTVALTSGDTTECIVDPPSLVLTPDTWQTGTTASVTAQDDDIADGDQACTIVTGPAVSNDPAYNDEDPTDITVTVTDDDLAGFDLSASTLEVSEPDGEATFTLYLTSQPTDTVTIALSTTDSTECVVNPPSLVLTPDTWQTGATATVAAQDDDIADGDQPCTIVTGPAASSNPAYNDQDPEDVTVTVTDDDIAGFDLSASTLEVAEPDGQATFTLYLAFAPTGTVTVSLTSSDTTECIVDPPSLVLTSDTWQTGATASVTAQDDDIADGDQPCTIVTGPAVSNDPAYNDEDPTDVTVTVTDDDVAGFDLSASTLEVAEPDGEVTFTLYLTSEPTDTVTIALSTTDTTECIVDSPSLVLTPDTWQSGATATVTAQDDNIIDGDQPCAIVTGPAASSNPAYSDLDPEDVTVNVIDMDVASFELSVSTLEVTEPDGVATFNVSLTSQPSHSVFVPVAVSNEQCTVSPTTVWIAPASWDSGVTVQVYAVDDEIDDGTRTCLVQTSSALSDDSNYVGLDPGDVVVSVNDDDEAGFGVAPIELIVSEPAGYASFTISLTSQPTLPVMIPLYAPSGQCRTVPESVSLSDSNWYAGVSVTVYAVDDDSQDGSQLCIVETGEAQSDDPGYDGLNPLDVEVEVLDDDTAGIRVTPTTLAIGEPDGADVFEVVLNTAPTAQVSFDLTISNEECSISVDTITLGPTNWNEGAQVTVTAVDDKLDDDLQICVVQTGISSSADVDYDELDPLDVTVYVDDDDAIYRTYLPLVLNGWPPVPSVPVLDSIDNADGDGSYTVSWSASSNAETYVLQEATNSAFVDAAISYTGPATSHGVSGRGAARYYYRVKALNTWGESAWSNVRQTDVVWEAEPNDDATTGANGPIVPSLVYHGTFPNSGDVSDYYYFELSVARRVEIWLTNIPVNQDYNLVLRDASLTDIGYSGETGNSSEHITKDLSPGRYYIQVYHFSSGGSTQPYNVWFVLE